MSGFYVAVGDQVQFAKTVGESDILKWVANPARPVGK
jgi:hypothetical protein